LHKLDIHTSYQELLRIGVDGNQFQILPIDPRHTSVLIELPHHHRDPFDRLLVAQATAEGVPLVSGDIALDAYQITRLW
jgi:PIN domain nuclease of toxin-antitoxin system